MNTVLPSGAQAPWPVWATPWRIAAFCLVWALVQWFSSANLDGYHDMLENYAWSQTWAWGTHKHPPFFAWVVGLWFSVFAQNDLSYRLLSYANVAVGFWGVLCLGRRLGLRGLADAAVLLLMWSFPYSTLAAKFNANTQLLSLWPWTATWLLASWQERGVRGLVYSVLLGLGAAWSMLSKYYSGVFLAGFLLPVLLNPQGRRWLASPRPYVALLVFGLMLWPHLAWVRQHDWITFQYASEQGGGQTQWGYVLRFALAPLYYWLLAWLGCVVAALLVMRGQGPMPGGLATGWRLAWRLSWRIWMPQGRDDTLFWLALSPWLLTLLCGMAGLAELSTPWAIPIGYSFSLLWLRNLQRELPQAMPALLSRLARSFVPLLLLTALLGAGVTWLHASRGHTDYYRPSREAAQAIASHWRERHPHVPLGWASGAWAENALLAFYALPQVRTLPGFPDEQPALLSPHPNWRAQGGVIICPLGPQQASGAPATPAPEGALACEAQARRWLQQQGQPVSGQRIEVMRQGWAFPRPRPFAYRVFEVMPAPRASGKGPDRPS